jgi:hypothetical protein
MPDDASPTTPEPAAVESALTLRRRSVVDADVRDAFAWHERAGAFERLTPPFAPARLARAEGGIRDGGIAEIKIPAGPITLTWLARHEGFDPPRRFVDVQQRGPFAYWRHEHVFDETPAGPGEPPRFAMDDRIRYRLPLGPLGALGAGIARAKLDAMFRYRHHTLARDLADHAAFASEPRRTVLITGASGTIGRALAGFLSTGGHAVRTLVRDRAAADASEGRFFWSPTAGELDPAALVGVDAVVHLAGEPVFAWRWSASKKRRIAESRGLGTALVARSLARRASESDDRPALISASAVGYYGSQRRGDNAEDSLDESSPRGMGFLADVCERWEASTRPAAEAGLRVAIARVGVVFTPAGGALKLMLPAHLAGAGGPIGSGRQRLPWISIDDAVRALHVMVMRDDMAGAFNLCAPSPPTQREVSRTVAHVLRRPAFVKTPAFAVRALMGELADEALLASMPTEPRRLLDAGFAFRDAALEPALRRLLGRYPDEPLDDEPPLDPDPPAWPAGA